MDDTRAWDHHRGVIRTKKGGFILGKDAVSHDHLILRDFLGKKSWFEVMLLHTLGRMPSPEFAAWVEGTYLGLSYPDARIWCNAAGAYAGTLRVRPNAATCAGVLASDSIMYASAAVVEHILPELEALYASYVAGQSVEDILHEALKAKRRAGKKPVIAGFSRPLINGDERIEPMCVLAKKLGFVPGPFEKFVFAFDTVCRKVTGEAMNLAAYHEAFMRDQGVTQEEIVRIGALVTHAGVMACYIEAHDRPPESFLPLRCDDIAFEGRAARPVPRRRHR